MLTDAPNLLTVGRVLAVPALAAAFYLPGNIGMWTTCVIFSIAAITDFFDGYLARSWSMQSSFGRMLDPSGDPDAGAFRPRTDPAVPGHSLP